MLHAQESVDGSSASRSFRLIRAIAWSALALTFVLGLKAPLVAQSKGQDAQSRIKALESKKAQKNLDLKKAIDDLDRTKKRVQKEFQTVSTRDHFNDIAESVASVIKKYAAKAAEAAADPSKSPTANGGEASKGDVSATANEAFKEIEKDLRSKLGTTVFDALKQDLKVGVAAMIEDKDEAPTALNCVRRLHDVVQTELNLKDFEDSWNSRLKAACSGQIDKLQAEVDQIDREIDAVRAMMTAGISGNYTTGLVPVPGGEFTIGVDAAELEKLIAKFGEKPENERILRLFNSTGTEKVKVETFLIGQYEVTHIEYWWFCQATGRKKLPTVGKEKKPLWPDGKVPAGWEHVPITCVDLEDAIAYCDWVNCRLPYEYEWEVAARSGRNGPDGRFWSFGEYKAGLANDVTAGKARAATTGKFKIPGIDLDSLTPVGYFKEGVSPLKIYDLNGNAGEWTCSPFTPRSSFKDIKFGKATLDRSAFDDTKMVIRGGIPEFADLGVSSIARYGLHPNDYSRNIGFRIVRSGTPGVDKLAALTRDSRLETRLVDFKPNKKDQAAARRIMAFDTRKERIAEVSKTEFNEELQVRGRTRSIMIANRESDPYNNPDELSAAAGGDDELKDCCPIGLFHTDVDVVEPVLKAGTYIVAFKNGGKRLDPTTGKKVSAQDAFLFIPEKAVDGTVRVENFGAKPAYVMKGVQGSKIELIAGREGETTDKVNLIYSFETRDKAASLQVILGIRVAKGATADFK